MDLCLPRLTGDSQLSYVLSFLKGKGGYEDVRKVGKQYMRDA